MRRPGINSRIIAWALYDWANSGFATTVMAGFFPLFFKQFYCSGTDPALSTARLGWAGSGASLAVALMAPFAGAAADALGLKKRFLLLFTVAGAGATACLVLPGQGQWLPAVILYAAALFCFAGANIFYDSLLNAVAAPEQRDFVSSLGFSLGYLGGGILLALNVSFTLWPSSWGITSPESAVRISFFSVALWWIVFSIPLFLKVPEPALRKRTKAISSAWIRLCATFTRIRSLKAPLSFLLAYWFYMDGVSSVIRMAVDYGLSIGLGTRGLISALLLVQFIGFPATLLMGKISEYAGTRRTILAAIAVYAGVTVWASGMSTSAEFYVLAAVIGMVQGGIQALSRSFFSSMIPAGEEAEFFGFYNITARFAAVIGPALIGTVTLLTGSARMGIMALLPLFAAGGGLLMFSRRERSLR